MVTLREAGSERKESKNWLNTDLDCVIYCAMLGVLLPRNLNQTGAMNAQN